MKEDMEKIKIEEEIKRGRESEEQIKVQDSRRRAIYKRGQSEKDKERQNEREERKADKKILNVNVPNKI